MREKLPTHVIKSWEEGYPLFFIRTKRGEWHPRFAWVTKDRVHWLRAQADYWDPLFCLKTRMDE